jgi:hypothetical protein
VKKSTKIVAGVVGGLIVLGAVASGSETEESAPVAKPSATAKPKTDPADPNKGQTPAQINSGFCRSVNDKLERSGLARNLSVAQRAFLSVSEYGYGVDEALKAADKVAGSGLYAGDMISDIDRLPALGDKQRAAALLLQQRLSAAPPVKYAADIPTFNAWMSRSNAALQGLTEACGL